MRAAVAVEVMVEGPAEVEADESQAGLSLSTRTTLLRWLLRYSSSSSSRNSRSKVRARDRSIW